MGISDSYFRITEFRNVSSVVTWMTHHMEVIIYVTINSEGQHNRDNCYLDVVGRADFTDIPPIFKFPLHSNEPKFRLGEMMPPLLVPEAEGQSEHPYMLLVTLVTASWDLAQENCNKRGMELLKLASVAQWYSIMEKTHKVFQHRHFELWKSHLIFTGYRGGEHYTFIVSMINLYFYLFVGCFRSIKFPLLSFIL